MLTIPLNMHILFSSYILEDFTHRFFLEYCVGREVYISVHILIASMY